MRPCWVFIETHHAGESEQRRLDLRHVAVLKQVVGFEDVMGLEAVRRDGFDEVGQVLQLKRHQAAALRGLLLYACVPLHNVVLGDNRKL